MDFILQPWPWYVSGPLIALIMLLLIYFGKTFGMSSNLRTLCTIGGAGKYSDFFRFDWKAQRWNLTVVLGAIIGG
ncbi:MAG: YeeE/YedE family protein, partial [Flavobacteriales bacterium]